MALKHLGPGEMVEITKGWTTPGPAREALVASPMLAPFLPKLELCLRGLVDASRASEGSAGAALVALTAEGLSLDAEHDACILATVDYLEALAALSGDAAVLEVLAFLLPQGRKHARLSYRGQAGEAVLLGERLHANPAMKKRIKEIPVLKGNVWTTVEQWMAAAKRLGEIETERAQLTKAPTDQATPADGLRARNEWVRLVNTLRAVATTEDLDEATDAVLFAPLNAAEASATKRAKGAAKNAPASSEGAPGASG